MYGKGGHPLRLSMSKRFLLITQKLVSLFNHQKKEYFQIVSTEKLGQKSLILCRNCNLANWLLELNKFHLKNFCPTKLSCIFHIPSKPNPIICQLLTKFYMIIFDLLTMKRSLIKRITVWSLSGNMLVLQEPLIFWKALENISCRWE